jgi:hypothetical protein
LTSDEYTNPELKSPEIPVEFPYQGIPGLAQLGIGHSRNCFHHPEEATHKQGIVDRNLPIDGQSVPSSNAALSSFQKISNWLGTEVPPQPEPLNWNAPSSPQGIFLNSLPEAFFDNPLEAFHDSPPGTFCDSPLSGFDNCFPASPGSPEFSQTILPKAAFCPESPYTCQPSNQDSEALPRNVPQQQVQRTLPLKQTYRQQVPLHLASRHEWYSPVSHVNASGYGIHCDANCCAKCTDCNVSTALER